MDQEVNLGSVRPHWTHAGALLALVLVATLWALSWQLPATFDAQLHDQISRSMALKPASADVVLIDIDEPSLAEIGPWPWPRTVIAKLVLKLRQSGARVQLWDLFLPEKAVGDDALNAALSAPLRAGQAPDVVLGQVLILDPQVQAPPHSGQLHAANDAPDLCADSSPVLGWFGVADSLPAARAGHLTATPDQDGGLRRLPAVLCHGTQRFVQLTLAGAELLQPDAPWQLQAGNALLGPAQWLRRGKLSFALDARGQLVVPYRQSHSQWPAISALRLLDGSSSAVALNGKVVLIGATAVGLVDTVSTPFHPTAPGVSVHAELMSAALSGQWTVVPAASWPFGLLLTAALGLALLAASRLVNRPLGLIALGALAACLPLLSAVAGRRAGYMLPISVPTLALMLFAFALVALYIEVERRRTRLLTHHLESFLPRDLAREIARQNPSGESLGKPGSGVVMALRVVGLERWCAAVDSLKALGLVHAISSLAEKQARLHGGTLEHVQGDTLLLVWPGVALADVQSAVQAGRGLQSELGALLGSNESEGFPLGLRMAIESGPFLLAVAGSRTSRRSLILGAAVDTVLAMLPLCEELASPLLMGQQAAQTGPRVALQHMGQFWLPDAGQPQSLYRIEP